MAKFGRINGLGLYSNIGRLGADPEMRFTPQGKAVVNFNVAVSKFKKVGEEFQEETTWWGLTLWEEAAERANENLHKGDLVYFEGEPVLETWSSQDGEPRAKLKLNFASVISLGPSRKEEASSGPGVRPEEIIDLGEL